MKENEGGRTIKGASGLTSLQQALHPIEGSTASVKKERGGDLNPAVFCAIYKTPVRPLLEKWTFVFSI